MQTAAKPETGRCISSSNHNRFAFKGYARKVASVTANSTRREQLVLLSSVALLSGQDAASAQSVIPGVPGVADGLLLPGQGDPIAWLSGPTDSAIISNPGNSWALGNADKQLYYPDWMEGTWEMNATFKGAGFPLGQRFLSRAVPGVTKASLIMVLSDVGSAMGQTLTWTHKYLKDPSTGNIVADRVFNTKQQVDKMLGYNAVRGIEYEPAKNPTRMSVVYATPRKGGDSSQARTEYDLRKAEVFINNRGNTTIPGNAESAAPSFIGWELYRQVSQAARQGDVYDYLVCNRYDPITTSSVSAQAGSSMDTVREIRVTQRVGAFLQPQDPQFFATSGKAVAVYDYEYTMSRMKE